MKKRSIFIALVLAFLCTMLPQSATAAPNEAELYAQYLGSNDYCFDTPSGYATDLDRCRGAKVQTHMVDLNGDSVKELLMHIYTGTSGPRGAEYFSFLLTIKNGKVSVVADSYYGGGSMGGKYLDLMYDTVSKTVVAVDTGYMRDGVYRTDSFLSILNGDDYQVSEDFTQSAYGLSSNVIYDIDEIRSKNTYCEENDGYLYCYYMSNKNVSKADYEAAQSRYEAYEYEMYEGTYYAPIEGHGIESSLPIIPSDDPLTFYVENCDRRYFTDEEIASLSKEDCQYALNAPYAKFGYNFEDDKLKNYFREYDWYMPNLIPADSYEGMFNDCMNQNTRKIVALQEQFEIEKSAAWDKVGWVLSAEQANAYAELVETAIDRFELSYHYDDGKAIYARLFEAQGEVYLWIAGARVMNESPFWHSAFEYNGKWLDFEYEELWYWNGFYAMEFEFVSDYGASMNLWPDGIEAYTFYRGTDYDGEAWGAFFPFEDGRLNLSPQWSYAWAVMYDYKFEDLDVNGKSDKEKAELFFKNQISSGAWPELNFDWSSLTVNSLDRAEITGGQGYYEFREKYCTDDGRYYPESTKSCQKSFDLENDDGTWQPADSATRWLKSYAQNIPQETTAEIEEPTETTALYDIDTHTPHANAAPSDTSRNTVLLVALIAFAVIGAAAGVGIIVILRKKR